MSEKIKTEREKELETRLKISNTFLVLLIVIIIGVWIFTSFLLANKFKMKEQLEVLQKASQKEYKEYTIDQHIQAVSNAIEANPKVMSPFLQYVVDIAVKSSPSAAIQVENYASPEMKKEMDQLRKSASVEALLHKDQDIQILQAQISALQREIRKVPQLEKDATALRQADVLIPGLQQQIGILQKNNSALQAENSRIPKLEAEIVELKKKSDSIPSLQQEITRLRDRISSLQREENRGNPGGGNPFVAAQKAMEAQKKRNKKREKKKKKKNIEGRKIASQRECLFC